MSFRPKAIMFKQEISELNLKQLKAGEKRWIGSMLGSSAALLFKEISEKSEQLFVLVARNNQQTANTAHATAAGSGSVVCVSLLRWVGKSALT